MMDDSEYESMARVEATHPWFVNRRRLIRGLVRQFASHLVRPHVLDAGCGTGTNLAEYARFGPAVGIELEPETAAISAGRGQHVLVGDLASLPFKSGSFDLVISTDVIEHIENDVAALTELRRVLAPSGRILATTPAYSWAYSDHDRCLHHVRRYDRRHLHEAFGRARLRVIHSARYNVVLAAPVLLARLLRRRGSGSDVARPIPRLVAPALDLLWHIEASLAQRLDLRAGLTHVAVLAHAD